VIHDFLTVVVYNFLQTTIISHFILYLELYFTNKVAVKLKENNTKMEHRHTHTHAHAA